MAEIFLEHLLRLHFQDVESLFYQTLDFSTSLKSYIAQHAKSAKKRDWAIVQPWCLS